MPLLCNASFKEFGSLVCLWQDVKLRKTQLEVGSLNATWSRDLWGYRVIVFFGKVSNCWLNSCGKFCGATRRRFFAICEKPYGGIEISPPPVRGLRQSRIKNERFIQIMNYLHYRHSKRLEMLYEC